LELRPKYALSRILSSLVSFLISEKNIFARKRNSYATLRERKGKEKKEKEQKRKSAKGY
jgi:hypothetical protein